MLPHPSPDDVNHAGADDSAGPKGDAEGCLACFVSEQRHGEQRAGRAPQGGEGQEGEFSDASLVFAGAPLVAAKDQQRVDRSAEGPADPLGPTGREDASDHDPS